MGLLPGEAMSNVDAAWLHMEDRTNLMTITGVLSFYEKLEFDKLKELIEDRFLGYDRFRQVVVESPLPMVGPRWVEDKYFNLRSHLLRVALPDPGGQEELQEMVSTLMSTPLDTTKPLWQFQYIENYRGGSAVVARIHHCIADGIALVRVLLGMTDDSPAGSPAVRRTRRRRAPLGGGLWLPEVVNDALYSVRKATGRVVEGTVDTVLDPARAVGTRRRGNQGDRSPRSTGAHAGRPRDPLQGRSRHRQNGARGRACFHWTRSRPSANPRTPRSTMCCFRGSPAPCGVISFLEARRSDPISISGRSSPSISARRTPSRSSGTVSVWSFSRCRSGWKIEPPGSARAQAEDGRHQELHRGRGDLRRPQRARDGELDRWRAWRSSSSVPRLRP